MDRLRDQHAAPIPRQSPATGHVVIVLSAPPGDFGPGQRQLPKRAFGQQLAQSQRTGPEPVLEYDAQRHPGRLAQIDQFLRAGQGAFDGFFHQHMLARPRHHGDNFGPLVRRCRDNDAVGAGIGGDCVQAVEDRKAESVLYRFGLGTGTVEHTRDIDPPAQFVQPLKMRFCRHTQPYQGQTRHWFVAHSIVLRGRTSGSAASSVAGSSSPAAAPAAARR